MDDANNIEESKYKKLKRTANMITSISIVIGVIAFFGFLIWQSFFVPHSSQNPSVITFNVTGVVNGTNADSLVQVHFDCIKYCGDHESTWADSLVEYCFNQCQTLGKEVNCINN